MTHRRIKISGALRVWIVLLALAAAAAANARMRVHILLRCSLKQLRIAQKTAQCSAVVGLACYGQHVRRGVCFHCWRGVPVDRDRESSPPPYILGKDGSQNAVGRSKQPWKPTRRGVGTRNTCCSCQRTVFSACKRGDC